MHHIDHETLELYLLGSEEVRDRRNEIRSHLEECPGCLSLLKEMEEYYAEAQESQENRAKAVSQALTLRTLARNIPTYTEFGPLSQIRKTVPAQVALFIMRHPFVSSVSAIGMFVLGLLALSGKAIQRDVNPSYARAKDEFLVVFDKEGEMLWKKHIGPGYDGAVLPPIQEVLTTVDVDGDGKNEIIALFGTVSEWKPSSQVVCYDAEGNERWKFGLHKTMTFGDKQFSDDYTPRILTVGDFQSNGHIQAIILFWHNPSWPCAIIQLDASKGTMLSEYWNPGYIQSINHWDITRDRPGRLIFAGENNAFDEASIVVLDPRRMKGYAPSTLQYTPSGYEQGSEEYYLLLPNPDIRGLASHSRSFANGVTFKGDGSIEVRSSEEFTMGGRYQVIFYFDTSMTCTKVIPTDEFIQFHRRMEAEGKLKNKVDERYLEDLRLGVQYWDGEKFVNSPTKNRRYMELAGK